MSKDDGSTQQGRYLIDSSEEEQFRGAILVTIADTRKLHPYFLWSCRTIGSSRGSFDMLVFHEGNQAVLELERKTKEGDEREDGYEGCAGNVRFVELPKNGLSQRVVRAVIENSLGDNSSRSSDGQSKLLSESTETDLVTHLEEVIKHIPKYLVEIKPMLGELMSDYLKKYSHWTYSDPDVLWGNIADWISVTSEAKQFDVITFSKVMDAGRLFLRGEFSLHRNVEELNRLWRKMINFQLKSFVQRMGDAVYDIRSLKPSEEIFAEHFFSAEGEYTDVVLKQPGIRIKISGRSMDDYSRLPVIQLDRRLFRCSELNITHCLIDLLSLDQTNKSQAAIYPAQFSQSGLPPIVTVSAKVASHDSVCKMHWLPVVARHCMVSDVYSKQSPSALRLERVNEAIFKGGHWTANDEARSRRVVPTSGALFHFGHWYNHVADGMNTQWKASDEERDGLVSLLGDLFVGGNSGSGLDPRIAEIVSEKCMVLWLRADSKLSFEPCASSVMLTRSKESNIRKYQQQAADAFTSKLLERIRREKDTGKSPRDPNGKNINNMMRMRGVSQPEEQNDADRKRASDRKRGEQFKEGDKAEPHRHRAGHGKGDGKDRPKSKPKPKAKGKAQRKRERPIEAY